MGNWNSSVDWLSGNSLEMDFYGGYKFKAGEVDLDVGALTYAYPGNSLGNTTELYGAATYGPFTAKYSHTVSKDYFGFATKAGHGPQGHQHRLPELRICPGSDAQGHAQGSGGLHPRFASDIKDSGVPNYMDYSVGGAYDFGSGLSLGAAVVGANKKDFFGPVNKSRVIVTLTKTL